MDSLADRGVAADRRAPDGATNMALDGSPRGPPSRMASDRSRLPVGAELSLPRVSAGCGERGLGVLRAQGHRRDAPADRRWRYLPRPARTSPTVSSRPRRTPGDLMDCYEAPVRAGAGRDPVGGREPRTCGRFDSANPPASVLPARIPAHDVLAYEAGTPVAARRRRALRNAQYRQRDAVIQHGSVSFDHAIEHHLGVFADHDVTPERFRERVTRRVREQAGVDRGRSWTHSKATSAGGATPTPGAGATTGTRRREATSWTRSTTDAWVRECIEPAELGRVGGRQRVVFGS